MGTELRPWYAVATPHEDIRKGRLEEAVFAANLWAVVQGDAREVVGVSPRLTRGW